MDTLFYMRSTQKIETPIPSSLTWILPHLHTLYARTSHLTLLILFHSRIDHFYGLQIEVHMKIFIQHDKVKTHPKNFVQLWQTTVGSCHE